MKITDIKTYIVGNPWKNWLFIKVFTDEGITGLGEATAGLSTKPNQADVEELTHLVIGEDPLHPERLWHRLYKKRFLNGSVAMNGIELACWDILGKSLEVPVWQLLGGIHRDSLRVYGNGWYKGPREPEFFAERASAMQEKGYTALKFDPFGSAYLQIDRKNEQIAYNIVKAVRESVGPDVDILIEGHDRFNIATAIRVGHWLEEFTPMFFETPVNSTDVEASITVANALSVPVALGERFKRLSTFRDVLESHAIPYIQPEVMGLGFSNIRKACAMAEAYNVLVASHQAQSPLCTAINAHLHAVIPNFLIQENFDDNLEPWTWDVLSGIPRVQNGMLSVPTAPGWGVELNETEAAKHPYGPNKFLRLFDDGWERRTSND
jgi:galactonate dehydratase